MAITGYQVLQSAQKYSGVKYSQTDPQSKATGFDCSGIVQQALADLGVKIPRTTTEQLAAASAGGPGKNVGTDYKNAQVGDVLHYTGHEEIVAYLPADVQRGSPLSVFSEATTGTVAGLRTKTNWPVIGIVRYSTDGPGGGQGNPQPTPGQGGDPGQVSGQLTDIVPGLNSVTGFLSAIAGFLTAVGNPGFWARVGLGVLGGALLLVGLYSLGKHGSVVEITKSAVQTAASTATEAAA
jgi:hypothetical protein